MEIKQLNERLVWLANSNSFNGNRGDIAVSTYKSYIDEVLNWDIPEARKQKILDQVYIKRSKILVVLE